ncbi:hypothetical protein ABT120_48070 [Nonomuraea angiospora]|uniref:hypothetical protein n=1 Tax=Nonomuraea angiospora TaxID=46172 RepID=UPI0033192DA6
MMPELRSNDAVIVAEVADLDEAATNAVWERSAEHSATAAKTSPAASSSELPASTTPSCSR